MTKIQKELEKIRKDAMELVAYLKDGKATENEYLNMYINAPEFKKLVDNAIQGIESEKSAELCICACCAFTKGRITQEEFYEIVDSTYDLDDEWQSDYIEPISK